MSRIAHCGARPVDGRMRSPLNRFAIVGGIGFAVDAAILTLLAEMTDMGAYAPRVVSFPVALSVTWYLNRVWTFPGAGEQRRVAQYVRYAIVQTAGALLNVTVYASAIFVGPLWFEKIVVVPLALASGIAMYFNFLGARYWAFRAVRAGRR